ncbi:MAG: signal peptidase II [Ilumatobacteraceae bacterium]
MTREPVAEPGTDPAAHEPRTSVGAPAAAGVPSGVEADTGGDAAAVSTVPAAPRRWFGRRGLTISLGVAAVVVVLDQLTKHWVLSSLSGHAPKHVIWTLQLNLSFNSGMAFSTGQGIGPIIGAVAIVVVAGLALSVRRVGSPVAVIAAGLVTGGAIGNLADRLFRGRGWLHGSVIDFIDFQWFPIFNIADSAITVGGALFFLWSMFGQGQRSH